MVGDKDEARLEAVGRPQMQEIVHHSQIFNKSSEQRRTQSASSPVRKYIMSLFRFRNSKVYWMDFFFHGQRIQESTGTRSKTLAKAC